MVARMAGVVCVLVLAGCAGPDPVGDAVVPTVDDAEPMWDWDTGILVPTWNVGDWWQYRVEYDSGESYDARIVVYAEDATHYHITADDRELLLRAGITHYPTFGAVAKATLDQSIHGADVSFFRFPMKNATWSQPYRDLTGSYTTSYAELPVAGRTVPGFITNMTDSADGSFRFEHGWSPLTKWFTQFAFDFDGVEPRDVVYTLHDWGTNHTGSVPVIAWKDHVHREFPTVAAAPGAPPPQGQTRQGFTMGADADLLLVLFAGAGGPGRFEFQVAPHDAPQDGHRIDWQSSGPGGFFTWQEHQGVRSGQWEAAATGAAHEWAFLFAEAYETHTSEVTL